MVLALRTDKPEAELYLLKGGKVIASHCWQAHRALSDTVLTTIENLLTQQKTSLTDLKGLIVFRGPGSFTGLRIGISVMNSLSYSLKLPLAGAEGADWIQYGLSNLEKARAPSLVEPLYGSEANVTKPKK